MKREVKRGTGGVGDLDREEVMRKQEMNDGKSRGRRGVGEVGAKTFRLWGSATYERDDS